MVRGERTAVLLVMEVEYSKLLSDIFSQVVKSRENAFFHESELLGCELKVFILSSWIEQRTNPSKVSDNSGSLLFNLWIFFAFSFQILYSNSSSIFLQRWAVYVQAATRSLSSNDFPSSVFKLQEEQRHHCPPQVTKTFQYQHYVEQKGNSWQNANCSISNFDI